MRAALRRWFAEHPASVGETYLEHAAHAAAFGADMLGGALASFLHALVPALCTTTGSRIVKGRDAGATRFRGRPAVSR
jgi:hypothetical protein